jgi:hypothetical protein
MHRTIIFEVTIDDSGNETSVVLDTMKQNHDNVILCSREHNIMYSVKAKTSGFTQLV